MNQSVQNTGSYGMPADNESASPAGDTGGWAELAQIQVEVGKVMPAMETRRLPLLQAGIQAGVGATDTGGQIASQLAEGMLFTGNAELRGPFSVSGTVKGNLVQAQGAAIAVIVTETGSVAGDILADKISVMGQTEGVLDAGQGHVTLHDSARVSGRVRYGRLQANGADINASLERVAPKKTGSD